MPRQRGQVIVELALSMPVILFIGLGFIEAGLMVVEKAAQDRSTAVIAQWVAGHPSESPTSVSEHELPGCVVTVSYPLPDLLEVTATCQYHAHVFPPLSVAMTSRESSAMTPVVSHFFSSIARQATQPAWMSVP